MAGGGAGRNRKEKGGKAGGAEKEEKEEKDQRGDKRSRGRCGEKGPHLLQGCIHTLSARQAGPGEAAQGRGRFRSTGPSPPRATVSHAPGASASTILAPRNQRTNQDLGGRRDRGGMELRRGGPCLGEKSL